MRDQILQSVADMLGALLSAPVVIGPIPPLGGYTVDFEGGAPIEIFRSLTSNEELPIVFNGKSENQQDLAVSMNTAHVALTTSSALPFAETWQIYAIETTAAPRLVAREQNKNYIYGSSFRIKFFAKGGQNG